MYAGIPTELARDGKLSYLARSVAMYVWSHDEKWQQSASAVAGDLSMDRGSVGKALAELQERGWLVREVHQIVGPSGKPRTAWERWHLQMTNRPFTPDEIRELSTPSDVRATPAPSTQTCGPHPHGGADDTSTGGADETRTIGMEFRNAPEVHSSNARDPLDETGSEGRSLAIAGSEAPDGAEDRRPEGVSSLMEPATGNGSFDDPFASEPAWRAESRASEEKRAAADLQPATAGGPTSSPWD